MTVQAMFQTYNGFGINPDGSSWKSTARRLNDGSWFEIRWWYPR